MNFYKLVDDIITIYRENAFSIQNKELKKMYYGNRLSTIRENWKILFLALKLVVLCVGFLLAFGNDGIVIQRTISFILMIIVFIFLEYLISKNDFLAKYCG